MVRSPTVHLSDGIFDSAVPMGLGAFGLRGPRVETRGYFLTSLTGLTLGAPLIPALNPRLFSVAPSGLQEWGHTVAAFGMTHPLPHVGAGDTPSRRGRRLEHAPVRGRGWILPASCVPPGGGGRRRRPGVDLNPAILGRGCRFVQPHSGLGRWGCPESRVHRLRGRPPVRPGTRCRAGAALGTCPRSCPVRDRRPRRTFKRGPVVTPQVNRVPKGRKRIAPGFNPGINAVPRSSPVGTTESGLDPGCIWGHI